ncbi:membrane hypothetical protein [Vibrio chagasii]|nr:membrane hypothetical protein [Vibrio chagasii]CAH6990469.1 membrane hypothetical protein [Vibrio chagasii]CAH7040761.1 membrane hypothetical protein [Vibrio chagasii]
MKWWFKTLPIRNKIISKLSSFNIWIDEALEFVWLKNQYDKLDKKLKMFINSCVIAFSFFFVAMEFPDGGSFLKKDSLVAFWFIPAFFIGAAVLMQKVLDDGNALNPVVLTFFKLTSFGALLGLTYGSVITLNNWYIDADTARWEPLFVATGLSTSGVYFTFSYFNRQLKKLKVS